MSNIIYAAFFIVYYDPMDKSAELFNRLRASYESECAPDTLLVGLSGGADSVCLAHMLARLRAEKGFQLCCVHVNHHLRPDSEDDERFVEGLCSEWALPLIVKEVDVSRRGNLEANARAARYEAFEEAMGECGAGMLVLAHHMDDQAETLLMRLMRGAGPTGLSAMRTRTQGIWRPLLSVRRAEIEGYLNELGIPWREDESNHDSRFMRNAVRHRLIPLMKELSPDCVPNIAAASGLMGDEEEFWQVYSNKWLDENASLHPSCLFLNTRDFDTLHIAARRRLVRAFCAKAGLSPDRLHTERLITLLPRESDNLPGDVKAFKTGQRLHLIDPRTAPLPLGTLRETQGPKAARRRVEVFDTGEIQGAQLRYRLAGDRIKPLGMDGTQSLSDYLIDRRMDRPFRDQWPVLAKGQDILWVVGFGMAQTAALTADTKRKSALIYSGRLPDETENQSKEYEAYDG